VSCKRACPWLLFAKAYPPWVSHFFLSGVVLIVMYIHACISVVATSYTLLAILHLSLLFIALCEGVRHSLQLCQVNSRSQKAIHGLVLAGLALLYCSFAALPVTERDSLIYHLFVPSQWNKAGRIVEIAWNDQSYFPSYSGLVFSALLQWSAVNGEAACAYYHLSYSIIAGVASIYAASLCRFSVNQIRLSGLLVLSIPLCLRFATTPQSDMVLAAYFAVAFIFFIQSYYHQRLGHSLGAAFCLGIACGFKYNAIPIAVCAAVAFAGLVLSSPSNYKRRTIITFFIGVLISGACYLPWGLRNWQLTGNPLYPFFSSLFGGSASDTPFLGSAHPLVYRHLVYGDSLLQILALPLRMIVFGEDDNPRQFVGVLTPLFVVATFGISGGTSNNRGIMKFFSAVCIASFISVILTFYLYARYFTPLLLPMVLLTVSGLSYLHTLLGRSFLMLVVMGHVAFFIHYSYYLARGKDLFAWWAGSLSTSRYMSKHVRDFAMSQYINAHLPSEARVFLLFTGNKYHLYRREVRGTYFSERPLLGLIDEIDDQGGNSAHAGVQLTNALKREGFSHLMIGVRLFTSFMNNLSSDKREVVQEFLSTCKPITQANGYVLYEL
jgi:hypothetical protein